MSSTGSESALNTHDQRWKCSSRVHDDIPSPCAATAHSRSRVTTTSHLVAQQSRSRVQLGSLCRELSLRAVLVVVRGEFVEPGGVDHRHVAHELPRRVYHLQHRRALHSLARITWSTWTRVQKCDSFQALLKSVDTATQRLFTHVPPFQVT